MRGVVILLIAAFALAPYYVIMTMVFEPLIDIVMTFNIGTGGLDGDTTVPIIQDILFLWGPFVYLAGWFVWAVRYYVSRGLFIGEVRVR